jgi:transcriptional regulator with GAF, ATPase, and Fis domain
MRDDVRGDAGDEVGMRERSALLAHLMGLTAALPASEPLAWRLCQATCRLVHADGGSIAVVATTGERTVVASTNTTATALEHIHDDLGDGPAVVAIDVDDVVTAELARADPRWPQFSEVAARRTRAVTATAVPMHSGSAVLGTMLLHRTARGPLRAATQELMHLADVVAVAVVHEAREAAGATPASWDGRREINQAVGMVMAQLAVPAPDALAVLRAHAFALDEGLADVAAAVLARRLDFGPDVPP